MGFTFCHWQAVIMWPYTSGKVSVAINDQMVGCDGCSDIRTTLDDIIHGIFGGDVLHDDPQFRNSFSEGVKNPFDENCFSVKDINFRIRDLSMDKQRNINLSHEFQD